MAAGGARIGSGGARAGAAALVLAALTACAAPPTPYRPAEGGFGYVDQQIETNRYRIAFAGNAATPRTTVQNYLLYRAAEVTLATGHDWFRLVDQNVERSTRYFGTVDPVFPYYGGWRHRRFDPFYDPFAYGTVSASPIDNYTAFADILVFEGEKPAGDVSAYDARDVLRRLEPVIVREPT